MVNRKPTVDGTYPFAGLTRHSAGAIPHDAWGHGSSMRWWASERTGNEEADPANLPDEGFATLVGKLPRASAAVAGWKHPLTGEWIETGKHNAVINPEVAEKVEPDFSTGDSRTEAADLDPHEVLTGDDALFNIPTDDYTIVNPADFLMPLGRVIRDNELGDEVFGEFRVSRGGGRVSADVFFDGKHADAPSFDDDRKPIVVGIQIDWDFFGDTAVRFQGMGMDFECVNALRQITETEIVKHAGDVESRVDWYAKFEEMLEELDLKTDVLSQMIYEASQETLDLSELPDDFSDEYDSILEALYAYSGLPNYLADVAANNCRSEAEDPFEPTWWDIHRGATFAISHEGRGEVGTGGAIEAYNRIANDMLANPAGMGDRVVEAYEDEREDDQTSLAGEGGGTARIEAAFMNVRDKRDAYEEREEQIERLLSR